MKAVDRVNARLGKLLADAESRLVETVLSPTLTAELVKATDNLHAALEPVHVEPDSLTHGEQTEPAANPPVEPRSPSAGLSSRATMRRIAPIISAQTAEKRRSRQKVAKLWPL